MEREAMFLSVVRTIWSEVLELHNLDSKDNFFKMGGDSLAGMRVIARIYEALGIEVPIRVLFENPELSRFANHISHVFAKRTSTLERQLETAENWSHESPLSYAQEGLFFLDKAGLARQAYNVSLALRILGVLDVGALDRAFGTILRRHESLRTRFEFKNGEATQLIGPPYPFAIKMIDVSSMPIAEAQSRARQLLQENAIEPFNLSTGPLLRASLVRLQADHHVLMISTHHIVSDGWSLLKVLTGELGKWYRQAIDGIDDEFDVPAIQYRHFVQWQRQRLQGAVLDEQRRFWKRQLAGSSYLLNLPIDNPRPAVASTRGAGISFELGPSICGQLRAIGTNNGATLFMVVLTAYQILLSRWCQQADILIGSPAAGRSRQEFEGLIGFFLNTLILRADLSSDPSFHQLLAQVKATAVQAYSHQDLPFEKLVAELQPKRDLSRHPIVQASLSFQNFPREVLSLPGLDVQWIDDEPVSSKHDLSLYLSETSSGLRGTIEYASELFHRSTIENLSTSFQELLTDLIQNPDSRVSQLPAHEVMIRNPHSILARASFLGDRDAAVLKKWNSTEATFSGAEFVQDVIARRAARQPEVVAVADDVGSLTYAELERRSNQLAHHLCSLGVGPEVVVALCLERCLDMVVALLGIFKSGGVYLPLDPDYPQERLRWMLEETHAPVLMTTRRLAESLPSGWTHVVYLDEDLPAIAQQPDSAPQVSVRPENLAYIIYTSGSTGRPKGVLIPHSGLCNLANAADLGFTESDRVLQSASLNFDASIWEIVTTLAAGATLQLSSSDRILAGAELENILREQRITVTMMSPSVLQSLGTPTELRLPNLRSIMVFGEACSLQLANSWASCYRLINGYGPTETTICASYGELNSGIDIVSLGHPIANARIHVLTEDLRQAPFGVAGELCIAGAGVSRGYLGQPGLTAERFVADPFSVCGERLYRTGDLVCHYADGTLEFIGRLDQQVKIRGFRIELGEIEVALQEHPDVAQAIVTTHGDETHRTLTAHLVCASSPPPDPNTLRIYLQKQLPDYMIPSVYSVIDSLPLTHNGKIDRAYLASTAYTLPTLTNNYVAPRSSVEASLADIWKDVLKIDQISIYDRFFNLGGDSILALRVQAEAQKLGIQFSLIDVFETPTLAALAKIAVQNSLSDPDIYTHAFDLVSRDDREKAVMYGFVDAYPLTKLQLGMLFHSSWQHGSGTYHAVTSHQLNKPLDQMKLQAALSLLIDRHPVLRTTIHLSGYEVPLQCVQGSIALAVIEEDISQLSPEQQQQFLTIFISSEQRCGFDLQKGALVRFFAHRLGDTEFQFTMSSHHAILDGWSDATILTELYETYVSLLQGQSVPPRNPLPLTFRDYIAAEQKALENFEYERYWSTVISSLPAFDLRLLPRGTTRGSHADPEMSQGISAPIDSQLLHALGAFAAEAGVPLKSVFLAAHLHALQAFTASSSVVTGLVTNARLECLFGDEVPGLYLNTVPVQFRASQLEDTATWQDLTKEALAMEEEVLRYRSYPVAEILRRFPGRDIFEVMFDFVNFHVYSGLSEGIHVQERKFVPQTNFPITVVTSINPRAGVGELSITFHVNRIEEDRVKTLLKLNLLALNQMIRNPHSILARASFLGDRDAAVLKKWNSTEATFSGAEFVQDVIARRAARQPEVVAVADDVGSLTYAELERRSNQLAHHLCSLGVGPEVVVALCLERCLDMVVALLGIFKSGGVYLPLDPDYPQERLRWMLEETHAPVLMTTRRLAESLPSGWTHVVYLDEDLPAIAQQPDSAPQVSVRPENLAYIIYTSGSTGRPKGVLIPHSGLCNLANAADLGFTESDRVLQSASLNFDASIWEIVTTLAAGATLQLSSSDRILAGAELENILREQRITVTMMSPSVLQSLGTPTELRLPNLRSIMVFGEACSLQLANSWASCYRLINGYGPTETTICASYGELNSGIDIVSLGHPIANARIHVLTEDLRQAPFGVAGELCIAGAGVSRGYLGQPGLTAERFVADPFSVCGERLYRTGDLVCHYADGTLEFIGRLDQQVKIRGFRIELGEIEVALQEHPDVAQAIVTTHGDETHRTLTAHLVCASSPPPDPNTLRIYLQKQLPDYMIPSVYSVIDSLPLTHNGKIDRAYLASTAYTLPTLTNNYVAPRSSVEASLADIWKDVLKIDQISIYDDFFEIGGDSLVATRVVALIQQKLHVDLPIREVFDAPTIKKLAESIENERWLLAQVSKPSATA